LPTLAWPAHADDIYIDAPLPRIVHQDGRWILHHVWNGDQTDHGLNFTTVPRVLKVKLGSYPVRP
jgi:hypothetical protein